MGKTNKKRQTKKTMKRSRRSSLIDDCAEEVNGMEEEDESGVEELDDLNSEGEV